MDPIPSWRDLTQHIPQEPRHAHICSRLEGRLDVPSRIVLRGEVIYAHIVILVQNLDPVVINLPYWFRVVHINPISFVSKSKEAVYTIPGVFAFIGHVALNAFGQ